MTDTLTETERDRIVRDIASWETELKLNGKTEPPSLEEVRDDLSDLSDEDLEIHWADTVGEWVLSRRDTYEREPGYEGADADQILDSELAKLKRGEPTVYGYLPGASYRKMDQTEVATE